MLTLLEMTLAGFESMPHNHTIFSSSRFQPLANHPGLRADAPGRATEHTGRTHTWTYLSQSWSLGNPVEYTDGLLELFRDGEEN